MATIFPPSGRDLEPGDPLAPLCAQSSAWVALGHDLPVLDTSRRTALEAVRLDCSDVWSGVAV